MGEVSADPITLDLLREARETVSSSPLGVINTPMIPWCQTTLPLDIRCNIHIKLENMQRTGSFKIRGVANQFARRPKGGHFVTMSAGNYGKSFTYASKHYGSKGKVVMPETAPVSRSTLIQVRACTMYRSFIKKKPVGMDTKSIASGLAPPFAGTLPFELCQRYVEGIVLINDEEIKAAVSTLYRSGLVVEPSGCTAFAAIVNDKIPELEGKSVVCILRGENIGKDELVNFPG
ncbi:uncharacterized protein LOC116393354 [Anarrhichthys ocellatus]|uniref:uncharacterized protein LOC116393354 n=1 Tax=Anarrhichthys ocellatus TaxID=433405 RepID=UPI0012EED156|nr:uncharacterized protein LOC116393354 [Anarrhichthys ocellatus]